MSPFVGCLLLLTGPAELVGRGGGGGGRGRLSLEEFSAVVEGGDCAGMGSIFFYQILFKIYITAYENEKNNTNKMPRNVYFKG